MERWYDPIGGRYAVVGEGLSADGRQALDGLVSELRAAGVTCELIVSEDRPWLAAVRAARAAKAGLVVVGRHDEGEDELHKVGSIALKLMRKSACPVWAVRPGHEGCPRKVLAATDLTAVGASATKTAAWLAQRAGAELYVAHFYQVPMSEQLAHGREPAASSEERRKQVEQIAREAIARELGPAAKSAHVHVGQDSPAHGLRCAVDEIDADVLVMGTVSRAGVPGLLVGNTAERLLGRVPCSLLTLKPAGFVSPIAL
jgi:nucleotide-binding universal stress UspA family protein